MIREVPRSVSESSISFLTRVKFYMRGDLDPPCEIIATDADALSAKAPISRSDMSHLDWRFGCWAEVHKTANAGGKARQRAPGLQTRWRLGIELARLSCPGFVERSRGLQGDPNPGRATAIRRFQGALRLCEPARNAGEKNSRRNRTGSDRRVTIAGH